MGVQKPEVAKGGEAQRLYRDCTTLLEGLDELGLYQAAAYVSMALDVMRRSFPHLARDE
jgi:hypothetical protein